MSWPVLAIATLLSTAYAAPAAQLSDINLVHVLDAVVPLDVFDDPNIFDDGHEQDVRVGEHRPGKRQFTIPPLIPPIPGVTEALNELAPPLPVLQVPTPPLPNPGYIPSDIRPKKFGFFWTGAGDNQHADFLASFSLDDDTFGTLLRVVEIPSSGNSPHHSGVSLDGKTLWGGGLLSLLKTQDTGYYFDVSDPYEPKYWKSDRALLASIADEVVAKPGGGFFYTYMGSAAGTALGRVVETDENYNIIAQLPHVLDIPGTVNIVEDQFTPHGLSIDFQRGLMLSSDFVVPLSILKPTLGINRAETVRLWDLEAREIISTIRIPNGGGMQDVKFIPGNPEGAALTTAVHLGEVWIIYPYRTDPETGQQGTSERLFNFGMPDTVAIYSIISKDGCFAYFTFTTANHVAALDITDLNNPIRLDDPYEKQPLIGPHYIKLTPDEKNLVVCDYFVQAGDISILNTPADYKIQYIDILPNGGLSFNRTIDFESLFPQYGGARPHSAVIFDYGYDGLQWY